MWPTSVSSSTFPKWPTPVFFGVSHDDSPPEPCGPGGEDRFGEDSCLCHGYCQRVGCWWNISKVNFHNNFKHPLKKTHWLRFLGRWTYLFFVVNPTFFEVRFSLTFMKFRFWKVWTTHMQSKPEKSVSPLLYLNRISWCLPQQVASPLIRFPAYLIDSYCVKIYACCSSSAKCRGLSWHCTDGSLTRNHWLSSCHPRSFKCCV